jgi:tRNA G10  N-methylase Trm11
MKYLFVLGRNIELSILELSSVFESEEIKFEILKRVKNGVLIEVSRKLDKGFIDRFGGVISIGIVLASGDEEKISRELKEQSLYGGKSNKLNYVILNFNARNFDFISSYLKQRFRDDKLKATKKPINGLVKMQDGKSFPKVSSPLVNERYFLFEDYFGRIVEVCDYDSVEKRDMGKPVRRNELSISPRLAKIMINLSGVKKGEVLLDPFCGIGVVLQEALLQGITVQGIDKDKTAIAGAKSNLNWFEFSNKNYDLINSDSSQTQVTPVNVIVTEPDLGELQKRIVSSEKAKKITEGFEKLMVDVLNNVKNSVSGKIVFTAPLILTEKKRIGCNFRRIIAETGMELVIEPVADFKENSIVGRDIVVLKVGKGSFKN